MESQAITDFETHDNQALDDAWRAVIDVCGLNGALLLSESNHDHGRRTYRKNEKVYRLVLKEYETSRRYRQNTLHEEYELLQRLPSCSVLARPNEYFETATVEGLVFDFYSGAAIGDRFLSWLDTCRACIDLLWTVIVLSAWGVAHRDFHPMNLIVGKNGRIRVLDFDQAISTSRWKAWCINWGGGPTVSKSHSWIAYGMLYAMKQLFKVSPLRHVIAKINYRRARTRAVRQLPILPLSASRDLKLLRRAWRLGQLSQANSPGEFTCYYSLDHKGVSFPGERPWNARWTLLSNITDYEGKRILELGCNLALLSTFLLAKQKAAAALAVDCNPQILRAASNVARAYHTDPDFRTVDFDQERNWESDLAEFKPDVVFALNVLRWVKRKERFRAFLSKWPEIIFEGHEAFEVESSWLQYAGFNEIKVAGISERGRSILHCRK